MNVWNILKHVSKNEWFKELFNQFFYEWSNIWDVTSVM